MNVYEALFEFHVKYELNVPIQPCCGDRGSLNMATDTD